MVQHYDHQLLSNQHEAVWTKQVPMAYLWDKIGLFGPLRGPTCTDLQCFEIPLHILRGQA